MQSLILSGSIQTTEAKAKAIKPTVDKIINQAKNKNTQRLLQQFLVAKPIRDRLIKDIAPALKDRTSGYTSVVKLGSRLGDGAMMVRMNLLVSEQGKVKSEKSAKTPSVISSEARNLNIKKESKSRDSSASPASGVAAPQNGKNKPRPITKRASRKVTK